MQYLPLILILVILLLCQTPNLGKGKLFSALVWYALAKILESNDRYIFELTTVISGHSLKHLAAAIACYCVIVWFKALVITKG